MFSCFGVCLCVCVRAYVHVHVCVYVLALDPRDQSTGDLMRMLSAVLVCSLPNTSFSVLFSEFTHSGLKSASLPAPEFGSPLIGSVVRSRSPGSLQRLSSRC